MHNYQEKIPPQLSKGTRVLIYAGDVDFICNWLGNKAWTKNLDWNGKSAFNQPNDNPWMYTGQEAGKLRQYQNFAFLQVHAAGHMVSFNLI